MPPDASGSEDHLKALLLSGKYSDLTLSCHGVAWRLHKAIVCMQSPVIAAAVGNSCFIECVNGIVSADRFDIDTMRRFILFLYLGDDYTKASVESNDMIEKLKSETERQTPPTTTPESSQIALPEPTQAVVSALEAEIRLNIVADYYQVTALAALTRGRVEELLQNSWNAEIFPRLLQHVEECAGDQKLHDIMTGAAARHINELVELPDFRGLESMSGTSLQILVGCAAYKSTQDMAEAQAKAEAEAKAKADAKAAAKRAKNQRRNRRRASRVGQHNPHANEQGHIQPPVQVSNFQWSTPAPWNFHASHGR